MRISEESKITIVGLSKAGYGAKKIQKHLRRTNIRHSISGIQYVIRNFNLLHTIKRQAGSGRRKSNARLQSRQQVKDLLDPTDLAVKPSSLRQTGRILHLSKSTIHRVARKDLKLNMFRKKRQQFLSEADRNKRIDRGRVLLDIVSPRKLAKVMWTDEKMFSVGGIFSSQNARVWTTAKKKKEVPTQRLIHPKKHFDKTLMVFAGVSLFGRLRIQFIDHGSTVNANYYQQRLLPRALEDCRAQLGLGFIWQQDGASAHTAASTQAYLQRHADHFIAKDQWPPNSPDLNPMDYGIWAAMSEKLKRYETNNLEDLKNNLTHIWRRLSQRFIGSIVRQFRRRVELMINSGGGYMEHLL